MRAKRSSAKSVDAGRGAPAAGRGASDVDAYLAAQPAPSRAALEQLRRTIRAAAPAAEEAISYQIPIFKQRGPLVGYAAFKDHCGFYLMSKEVLAAHQEELEAYDASGATIRFQPSSPLPAALVRKLVEARIAENEAAAGD